MRVEPTVSRKPVAVRSSSRTVAEVRTSTPPASASALRQPPEAADEPGEHRRVATPAAAAAAAASSEPCSRSSATTWGMAARADRFDAWPAYTPPSSGSASRSTTSWPEPRPEQLGDRDVMVAQRAAPSRARRPLEAVVGEHPGGRQSRRGPAVRRAACAAADGARRGSTAGTSPTAGCTSVDAQLRGQPDGLRAPRQHRLGADVDLDAGRPCPAGACRRRRASSRAPAPTARRRPGRGPRSARRCRRPPPRRRGARRPRPPLPQ